MSLVKSDWFDETAARRTQCYLPWDPATIATIPTSDTLIRLGILGSWVANKRRSLGTVDTTSRNLPLHDGTIPLARQILPKVNRDIQKRSMMHYSVIDSGAAGLGTGKGSSICPCMAGSIVSGEGGLVYTRGEDRSKGEETRPESEDKASDRDDAWRRSGGRGPFPVGETLCGGVGVKREFVTGSAGIGATSAGAGCTSRGVSCRSAGRRSISSMAVRSAEPDSSIERRKRRSSLHSWLVRLEPELCATTHPILFSRHS